MALVVQKFGGTSVANIDRIKEVAKIINLERQQNNQVVVIVSAMAGITNALITKCNQVSSLSKGMHMNEYDAVLSSGEIVTAALLALELQNIGLDAISLQGWQVPIKTNNMFSNALIETVNSEYLIKLIKQGIVPVITGFQGVTREGRITTLGKGGSDTTAALVAAAIKAQRCDIYTDVDGIYTADPRIIHDAKKIDKISAKEAVELSSSGAKVLHPRAALAALRYGFDMMILSSFVKNSGTLITSNEINMENRIITAIASNKNLLKIDIDVVNKHFMADMILTFSKEGLQIDKINTLDNNKICLIAALNDINRFEEQLENLKKHYLITKFTINTDISTVSLIGYGIKNNSKLIWQIADYLNKNNIEVLSIYSSEVKITIMIKDSDTEKAIKILHQNFYL